MSDSKVLGPMAGRRPAGERSPTPTPTLWSDYQQRSWAERATVNKLPPAKLPVPGVTAPSVSRHSAITGTLHSYANYKTWAERVRTSWEPDKDKTG